MKRATTMAGVGLVLLLVGQAALADWNPGDGHKMHRPQLPDPDGWDIAFIDFGQPSNTLADDFQCTQTGPITDIHFWLSFQGEDWSGNPNDVGPVTVGLWSNQPADAAHTFSQPLERLWSREFKIGEFAFRQYGQGPQGFYNPATDQYVKPDHNLFYQINIVDIRDPFEQKEGEIYWLSLDLGMVTPAMPGWKTSLDHFEDDAVYGWTDPAVGMPVQWNEIRDPLTGESLDLAFVITPEPATLALVACGAGAALIRRRRR